jgi:hypothetical protein
LGWCPHGTNITTITAGLAREVCEACGRVRIHYVESAVQIYPTPPRPIVQKPRHPEEPHLTTPPKTCMLCSQSAVFTIPDGPVCDEHAWQAAARTSWDESDVWVPIRIDKSNA